MLLEEFLKPMGVTQRDLANTTKVPYQRINEIIFAPDFQTFTMSGALLPAFGYYAVC
jgi:plasmid maintenance system antidote protein VapI